MSGLLGGTSSLAFPLPAAAPERVFVQTNPPLLQQEDPFTDTRWADSLCPKTCLSHTTWYQQSIVFAPSEEQNLPGKTTGAGPGTTQPPLFRPAWVGSRQRLGNWYQQSTWELMCPPKQLLALLAAVEPTSSSWKVAHSTQLSCRP